MVEPRIPRRQRSSAVCQFICRSYRRSSSPQGSTNENIPTRLFWLAITVTIIVLTDIVALAYTAHMLNTVFQDKDYAAKLEFADPYIGLKTLYESGKINASKIDPILLRPQVSAQVFLDEPRKLAPRGEHDYWSPGLGTLSTNERHLHVTPEVSNLDAFYRDYHHHN